MPDIRMSERHIVGNIFSSTFTNVF